MGAVTIAVSGREEVGALRGGGLRLVDGGEVASPDHLGVALLAGEGITRLARTGKRAAVSFLHFDRVRAHPIRLERIGRGGLSGAQRLTGEGLALRPIARIQNPDNHTSASILLTAKCRPDAARAGQFEEVDGVLVAGELAGPVLGYRENARRALQRTCLVRCQARRKAIKADGVMLQRLGTNPRRRIGLLLLQVGPITLGAA